MIDVGYFSLIISLLFLCFVNNLTFCDESNVIVELSYMVIWLKCSCSMLGAMKFWSCNLRKTRMREIRSCIVQLVDAKEWLLGLQLEMFYF